MIVCLKCGRQNPDGTTFCESCSSFLEWTGEKGSQQPHSAVSATVAPREIHVEPGTEAALEIEVRNRGTVVDQFRVGVSGPPATWAVVEPTTLSLFPDKAGSVRILLHPPRSPAVPAGPVEVRIRVASAGDGSVAVEVPGSVVVGGYSNLTASIVPQTSEGNDEAVHTVIVANEGNRPADVQLEARDPDEALRFDVEPAQFTIGPGESRAATLRVASRGLAEIRREERRPFHVALRPLEGTPVRLEATTILRHVPRERRRARWPLWLAAAAAVVLVMAGAASAMVGHFPPWVSPSPAAQASPGASTAPMPSAATTPTPSAATPPPAASASPAVPVVIPTSGLVISSPTPVPTPKPVTLCSGSGTLQGTYVFDFETCKQASPGDVWWEQMTGVVRQLVPEGGAALAPLPAASLDAVTLADLQGASYGTSPINGNNDATNQLRAGTVIAVRTRHGHYAKVRIDSYGYNLGITYVTYK